MGTYCDLVTSENENASSAGPTGDPVSLLGALADESRLRTFAALVLGAQGTDEIAERADLPVRDVLRTLARLEAAGLAVRTGEQWRARPGTLSRAVAAAREKPKPLDYGETSADEAAVLRTFMPAGRLVQIPVQQSKRAIVLDHIARVFEPGRRYPEAEVNALLRAFHADYAALRRYLVDEGLMSRAAGEYWRTGGTVPV